MTDTPPSSDDFEFITSTDIDVLMLGMRQRLNALRDSYGHALMDFKDDRLTYVAIVKLLYDTYQEAVAVDRDVAEQTHIALLAFALRRVFYKHMPITTDN